MGESREETPTRRPPRPPPQKKQNKKTQLQNANILQNLAAIHNLDRRQT